jgi:hypothetical protein
MVTELADIPVNLIHEPWKLNPIEQQFYNCEIGKTIRTDCHTKETEILCGVFKKDEVKEEGSDFEKHVSNPNRRAKKDKIIMTLFLKWENIITNYEIDPTFSFFAKGVELDLFDGKAYISLVGFMFKEIV